MTDRISEDEVEDRKKRDRIIISDIKNRYAWGIADKDDIIDSIRSQYPMSVEEASSLHDIAIQKIVNSTTISKDEKRARALHRLAYIQSKVSSGESFNPKVLIEIERLRSSIEGTESPKEINNNIRAASIVASTVEEADAYMQDLGFINQTFDDKEIDQLLEEFDEIEERDLDSRE